MKIAPREELIIDGLQPESNQDSFTYCLVHGSWHDPLCWDSLRFELEAKGHQVITPDVPIDVPGITYEDYAESIGEQIDDPANTTIVGHSRAGNILPRIIKYIGTARQLIYLSAGFDPSNDHNLRHYLRPTPEKYRPEFTEGIKEEDELVKYDPEIAKEIFYHDCPPVVKEAARALLRPMVRADFQPPVKRWPNVPAAAIWGRNDKVITQEYYQYTTRYGKLARSIGNRVMVLNTGHFPQLADPIGVSEAFERLDIGVEAR